MNLEAALHANSGVQHTMTRSTKNKTRNGGKANANAKPKTAKARTVMRANKVAPITVDEARYAALLYDPCKAPLSRPVYPTGGSGFMQRYETDFIIGNDVGSTAGSLAFIPNTVCGGYTPITQVSPTNVSSVWYLATAGGTSSPANDTTACQWNLVPVSSCPGQVALGAIAGAARPVAACLQVFWPGSELNRQGFISLFRCNPGDLNPLSTAVTVASLRASSPYVARMPQDHDEVKWQPDEGDTSFGQVAGPQSAAFNRITNGGAECIGVTWSGLPAAAGVRVRLVAVYEWMPVVTANAGTVLDGGSAEPTRGSLNRVIAWLKSFGPQWYLNRGRDIAAFLQRSANYRSSPMLTWHDEL